MDRGSGSLSVQKSSGRRPVGCSQAWEKYGVLLPSQQTRKLKEWSLNEEQQLLVNASGLGHLALTTGFTIDRSLLTAFCERWNNETNTAHFTGFEMAPSLRDVAYILGIPVTGHVVTGEPIGDEAVRRLCLQYLGDYPGNGEQLSGLIRLTWLYRRFHQLPANPSIKDIAYSTRAYLLYLVGATLFPDTMRGFVSPRYLLLLADFKKIREYAWGAAALAHLYRGLSVAVTPNSTTQFLGSATLLMTWIYEYLPVTQPQQKNTTTLLPRACQWNSGGANRGPRKKVSEWKKVFDLLKLSDVNWNPYKDISPAIIPQYCIESDMICHSQTWLISFNIKEIYVPDRFARQFGREQYQLQGVPGWHRRSWSKGKDWRVEYAREIEEFHQLVGCRYIPPPESTLESPCTDMGARGSAPNAVARDNASLKFSVMVEDLKNDLPVIDRYLDEQLLPGDVASFLERVSTMLKAYPAAQSNQRADQETQDENSTVKSKHGKKMRKTLLFPDPPSPPEDTRSKGISTVVVPYQDRNCGPILSGTMSEIGVEGYRAPDMFEQRQWSNLSYQSPCYRDSNSPESNKRKRPSRAEIQPATARDVDGLRRGGRFCVQLKMFKQDNGVGAKSSNQIFL